LLRHAENPANLNGEFSYKVIDYSLTPHGVWQAEQAAEYFRDKGLDEIYSSPLKRAQETAAIISQATGVPVTVLEQFREINVGRLERQPPSEANHRLYDRIMEDWLVRQKPESRFPGGEDYPTLRARIEDGLRAIVAHKTNRRILLVAHGGIFVATIRALCLNARNDSVVDYRNCGVSELRIGLRAGHLEAWLKQWDYCAYMDEAVAV
jgi:broad specificity phosphatase PhoE